MNSWILFPKFFFAHQQKSSQLGLKNTSTAFLQKYEPTTTTKDKTGFIIKQSDCEAPDLRNTKYLFIAIDRRSTLSRSGLPSRLGL